MIFKNHMLVAVGVNGASESAQESCLADHGGKFSPSILQIWPILSIFIDKSIKTIYIY